MLISDDDSSGAVDKSVERNNDKSFFPWTYPWLLAYPHNPWPNNKELVQT